MVRNRLGLQALVVVLMGVAAHLTAPGRAVTTISGSMCGTWSRCTGVCGVANPCSGDCAWICMPPPNGMCDWTTAWYEACIDPM